MGAGDHGGALRKVSGARSSGHETMMNSGCDQGVRSVESVGVAVGVVCCGCGVWSADESSVDSSEGLERARPPPLASSWALTPRFLHPESPVVLVTLESS